MTLIKDNPVFSVVVCTHNPRMDYLGRVLGALRNQSLSVKYWELLLVDNRSNVELACKVDLTWHPLGRIIREEDLGLTPARLRAIDETRTDLLVFCDDDGLLREDYLETALAVAGTHARLGVWGGTVNAEFEQRPPDWTQRHWQRLALRTVTQELWSNFRGYPDTTPCGVGMCVRRVVAEEYSRRVTAEPLRRELDRKGQTLTSGGDDDLAWTAHDLGLGTGLFPTLVVTHLMPAGRLEEDYLLRLAEAQSYSGVIVETLHGGSKAQLPGPVRRRAGWLKRCLTMNARDRRFLEARLKGQQRALRELSGNRAKA